MLIVYTYEFANAKEHACVIRKTCFVLLRYSENVMLYAHIGIDMEHPSTLLYGDDNLTL